MMKISDLYAKYQVMPQLATHQLRVASVGKLVAENWKQSADSPFITRLCLVHDLGNIVKFDLSEGVDRSKFGEIENLKFWRQVQQRYWDKYGKDAHVTTVGMLQEAGLGQYIPPIHEEAKLYFAEAKKPELAKASLPAIILMYADCRVTPTGVTSYRERIDDLKTRYGGSASPTWYEWTYWFDDWMRQQVTIDLDSMTEDSFQPLFDELLTSEI